MDKRPDLNVNISCDEFQSFYYLKEELIEFCKEQGLQVIGSKIELTDRISCFLKTGQRKSTTLSNKRANKIIDIFLDSIIEDNFICSETHREFYKNQIGISFSFNVDFQKWLKSNSGKTYKESIDAYYKIKEDKKNNKSMIDSQFEYNTYIRDFFLENKDKKLEDAIKCWKYKKSIKGHNKYESSDLMILIDE